MRPGRSAERAARAGAEQRYGSTPWRSVVSTFVAAGHSRRRARRTTPRARCGRVAIWRRCDGGATMQLEGGGPLSSSLHLARKIYA
ncbi:unnamed protein product [Lampetra fluviatilis]